MQRHSGGAIRALVVPLALGAATASAAPREARSLYDAKCALCHGHDGKSNPALSAAKVRNFTDAEWQKARSDADLRRSIESGKEGTLMRAFKDDLSAEEITGLIKLIRAFAPTPPPSDPAAK